VTTSAVQKRLPDRTFFLFVGALLLILAVGIQTIMRWRDAQQRKEWDEQVRFEVRIFCEPGGDTIRKFVEARLDQETISLDIGGIAEVDLASFSHLKRLRSLKYLTLTRNPTSRPIGTGGQDLFLFPPVLTDDAVRELCQIKTLRLVTIWYGSFTEAQKRMLQRANPSCIIEENLNKL
jgi:hypothetical protein